MEESSRLGGHQDWIGMTQDLPAGWNKPCSVTAGGSLTAGLLWSGIDRDWSWEMLG